MSNYKPLKNIVYEPLNDNSIQNLIKTVDKNTLEKITRPVEMIEYKPLENVIYSYEFYDPSASSDIKYNRPISGASIEYLKNLQFELDVPIDTRKFEDTVLTSLNYSLNYSDINSMEVVDPSIQKQRSKLIIQSALLKFLCYDLVYSIMPHIK